MVIEQDVLENEDMGILDQFKEFVSSDEAHRLGAAKQLLIIIDRAVSIVIMFFVSILTTLYSKKAVML